MFHRKWRVGVAERQRGVKTAVAGRLLGRCFRGYFERRHRCVLADLLGNDLIDSRGEAGAASLARAGATQPGGRIQSVHRSRACVVHKIPDRRDVFLERLQRLHDRIQFEVGAGPTRSPSVHVRPVLRVPHDGAVRNIEKACVEFRRRGRLSHRGCSRNHGVQERQGQCHTRALEHCSAR